MRTHLSELRHRQVLDVGSATSPGTVSGVVLSPDARRVTALVVHGADDPLLPWDRITSLGQDAVSIESVDDLVEPSDEREQAGVDGDLDPLGKPVLTRTGRQIGQVTDVVLESDDGQVVLVQLGDDAVLHDALVGLGRYALVVEPPG